MTKKTQKLSTSRQNMATCQWKFASFESKHETHRSIAHFASVYGSLDIINTLDIFDSYSTGGFSYQNHPRSIPLMAPIPALNGQETNFDEENILILGSRLSEMHIGPGLWKWLGGPL